MSGTITIPTVTIRSPLTTKKDLGFFIAGASIGGALAPFDYQMVVEWEGEEYDMHVMPKPDPMGRVQMSGIALPRKNGTILISGLYRNWNSELQAQFNISPLVIGRCVYNIAVHGKLLFNITPETVTSGSTSDANASGVTKSDPTYGASATGSYAPGGVGGSVTGSVTKPGDATTTTRTGTAVTNVTSVSALKVEQIAAPK